MKVDCKVIWTIMLTVTGDIDRTISHDQESEGRNGNN